MLYIIDAEAAQTSALKVAFNLMRQKGIAGIYRGFGATFLRYCFLELFIFIRIFIRICLAIVFKGMFYEKKCFYYLDIYQYPLLIADQAF